ncbi:hypothetical protein MMC29_000338 [Sticta canariensis]|nr:hypothetical protein [Sticta canariensis]
MAIQALASAKIDSPTFITVLWSETAMSLSFLAFRLFVRIRSFGRIYADDVLVLVAWLLFFASVVILQSQQTAMYNQYALAWGTLIPTPEELKAEETFMHTEVAIIIMYYTSLWTVKLSVLVFFRRLGQKVRGQKIWWWCITSFTVATWAICIGTMRPQCFLRSLDYVIAKCTGPSPQKFSWENMIYICVFDVITDAAIITIPILMLRNTRISWKKKLALMSIFSLTIVVIAFSIVRVALVNSKQLVDISWLYMWSNFEVAVSVMVSCLASFRQLFVMSGQSGLVRKDDKTPLWRRALPFASKSSEIGSSSSRSECSFTPTKVRPHGAVPMPDSTKCLVPLDAVYVRHDRDKSANMGPS